MPRVGDVVEVVWLDSGTRSKVDSHAEGREVRCHEATVWGRVARCDDRELVIRTEVYDDGAGVAEAIARDSIVSLEVLKRE